jgi:hypothetical protein
MDRTDPPQRVDRINPEMRVTTPQGRDQLANLIALPTPERYKHR